MYQPNQNTNIRIPIDLFIAYWRGGGTFGVSQLYEQLKESAWGEILQTTTGFFTALNINTLVKCLKNTTHGQLAANYGNAALVPAGFDVVWKYNPWIRVNDQAGAEISALKCRETYKAGTDEVQITPDVTHKALFSKNTKGRCLR